MKLTAFTNIIQMLFTDKMDVYKYIPQVNSDGTTDNVLALIPDKSNIPCRVSFFKMESVLDSEVDSNPLSATPKLFFPVTETFLQGDYVQVRRMSGDTVIAQYEGNLGLPNTFETHKEAVFLIKGSA